jgi:tRNA acetyltransferase TAN1
MMNLIVTCARHLEGDTEDELILIEILGIVTGISILKKSDILSLEKTKRSMSD